MIHANNLSRWKIWNPPDSSYPKYSSASTYPRQQNINGNLTKYVKNILGQLLSQFEI